MMMEDRAVPIERSRCSWQISEGDGDGYAAQSDESNGKIRIGLSGEGLDLLNLVPQWERCQGG